MTNLSRPGPANSADLLESVRLDVPTRREALRPPTQCRCPLCLLVKRCAHRIPCRCPLLLLDGAGARPPMRCRWPHPAPRREALRPLARCRCRLHLLDEAGARPHPIRCRWPHPAPRREALRSPPHDAAGRYTCSTAWVCAERVAASAIFCAAIPSSQVIGGGRSCSRFSTKFCSWVTYAFSNRS
jgi:hypothetical protein